MPIAYYTEEDHDRFHACALALHAGRTAGQRVLEQTMLRPLPGSRADRDSRELKSREPPPPDTIVNVVMNNTLGPHVYAAGEYVGAMSLLYEREEIHVAPLVLARATIEHCAQALWILGSPNATVESRVARALLDPINGLEQAEQYAGYLRGEGSPEHLKRKELTAVLRTDAHGLFAAPYEIRPTERGRKRPALGGEYLPSHTEIVVRAVRLMSTSLDDQQARGAYALLSASVHATPNEIVDLTAPGDESDASSISITRDRRAHEPMVRMIVSFFYSASATP